VLIYDPAYDPYHCCIRSIAILVCTGEKDTEIEKVSAIDYVLLFPTILLKARLPKELTSLRRMLPQHILEYRRSPAVGAISEGINSIQRSAYARLASANVLNENSLKSGFLSLSREGSYLSPLLASVDSFLARNDGLNKHLIAGLGSIALTGRDGLKARLGIGSYRYDFTG
jgi:hypothetical protein